MWFSKADGGREEVVEVPPTPPFEDDLENGLLEKSGMPDEAADRRLLVSSVNWIEYGSEELSNIRTLDKNIFGVGKKNFLMLNEGDLIKRRASKTSTRSSSLIDMTSIM